MADDVRVGDILKRPSTIPTCSYLLGIVISTEPEVLLKLITGEEWIAIVAGWDVVGHIDD